jgi:hypothetical protein
LRRTARLAIREDAAEIIPSQKGLVDHGTAASARRWTKLNEDVVGEDVRTDVRAVIVQVRGARSVEAIRHDLERRIAWIGVDCTGRTD